MKYPCIESTEEFNAGPWRIRLWINESEVQVGYPRNRQLVKLITQYVIHSYIGRSELIRWIAEVSDELSIALNAVQVIDTHSSSGVVVYLVDFAGDVHG